MPQIGFPTNWSLLKIDNEIQPYYYAMAYTDDHLGYQFFVTDFTNVWAQSAYFDDVVRIARARNIILTEPDHVREVVGVLNGCLFQQFYDNATYQREYQCEFHLHTLNPHQHVAPALYLTIAAKNGFKWDFNADLVPPRGAAQVLKMLNFNLFNMVFRMDMQSRSLVGVIGEKDRAIQFLLEVVDQLHGNSQVMKFKGNSESSRNSRVLRRFNYNEWVKNWKISKIANELNHESNDIWAVVDTVSRNPDLWEFSTNYFDSRDESVKPAVAAVATAGGAANNEEKPEGNSPYSTFQSLGSFEFNDTEEKIKQEEASFVKEEPAATAPSPVRAVEVNPQTPSPRKRRILSPHKKRRNQQDLTNEATPEKQPRETLYCKAFGKLGGHDTHLDEDDDDKDNSGDNHAQIVDSLSQSFNEYVDIKSDGRVLKVPMSPAAKKRGQSQFGGAQALDASTVPDLKLDSGGTSPEAQDEVHDKTGRSIPFRGDVTDVDGTDTDPLGPETTAERDPSSDLSNPEKEDSQDASHTLSPSVAPEGSQLKRRFFGNSNSRKRKAGKKTAGPIKAARIR